MGSVHRHNQFPSINETLRSLYDFSHMMPDCLEYPKAIHRRYLGDHTHRLVVQFVDRQFNDYCIGTLSGLFAQEISPLRDFGR